MRPTNRGSQPLGPDNATQEFARYRVARAYPVERPGAYCPYCERPITHVPHVEPVRPKAHHPDPERNWDNLLLACTNCNDIKGHRDVHLDDYYWPDAHNTSRLFGYDETGGISTRRDPNSSARARAENTIALTGLDRVESETDRHRMLWREVWEIAEETLCDLLAAQCEPMRRQAVRSARGHGFFSVRMPVFRDGPDMLRRFIRAFPGTAGECFENDGTPKDAIDREQ